MITDGNFRHISADSLDHTGAFMAKHHRLWTWPRPGGLEIRMANARCYNTNEHLMRFGPGQVQILND
jgi:hypothetical protein